MAILTAVSFEIESVLLILSDFLMKVALSNFYVFFSKQCVS